MNNTINYFPTRILLVRNSSGSQTNQSRWSQTQRVAGLYQSLTPGRLVKNEHSIVRRKGGLTQRRNKCVSCCLYIEHTAQVHITLLYFKYGLSGLFVGTGKEEKEYN